MIEHPADQGSTEWREARYGRPTASEFSRIVTPTGKVSRSQTREQFLGQLCAEWALGDGALDPHDSHWTRRGREMEPAARASLEFVTGHDIRPCGLIYRDADLLVAASPDGLTADARPVELKCPRPGQHLLWLAAAEGGAGVPPEHRIQCQAQLWVCRAERGVWASYCPGLPLVVHEPEADAELHAVFAEALALFCADLEARKAQLRARLGDVPIAADYFSNWDPK